MSAVDGPAFKPGIITRTGEWIICNIQHAQPGNIETFVDVRKRILNQNVVVFFSFFFDYPPSPQVNRDSSTILSMYKDI